MSIIHVETQELMTKNHLLFMAHTHTQFPPKYLKVLTLCKVMNLAMQLFHIPVTILCTCITWHCDNSLSVISACCVFKQINISLNI